MVTPINQTPYASAVNVVNQFGSSLNLPEMGMLVQMERHNILQTHVVDQFQDMQNRNKWLKDATEALNALRSARQKNPGDGDIPLSSLTSPEKKAPPETGNLNMEQYFQKYGISYPPRALNQADVDTCISNLKASIDTVNTNSQLDMVRMQGLMDKVGQATEFMTNWTAKTDKTMDSIIGNIR
jgi:hypothetical protein